MYVSCLVNATELGTRVTATDNETACGPPRDAIDTRCI